MEKFKYLFTISMGVRLIAVLFLLIGFTEQGIGYYKFLRWVVCSSAIYVIYMMYKEKEELNLGIWIFGLTALLFNPIIPFYIGKTSWHVADVVAGLIFITSIFISKEKKEVIK